MINHVLKQMRVSKSQQIGSDLSSRRGYRSSVILKGPRGSFSLFSYRHPNSSLLLLVLRDLFCLYIYKRKGGKALHQ